MAFTNFTGPVQSDGGFQTAGYLLADLPSPATDNVVAVVTDANGGAGALVFGKGGSWIDVSTGNPVV